MHRWEAGRKPTHGRYTKSAVKSRREVRDLVRALRKLLGQLAVALESPVVVIDRRANVTTGHHHVIYRLFGPRARNLQSERFRLLS